MGCLRSCPFSRIGLCSAACGYGLVLATYCRWRVYPPLRPGRTEAKLLIYRGAPFTTSRGASGISTARGSGSTTELWTYRLNGLLYATAGGRNRNGWGSIELLDEGGQPAFSEANGSGSECFEDWKSALAGERAPAIGTDRKVALIWRTQDFRDWGPLRRVRRGPQATGPEVRLLAGARAGPDR